MKVLWNTILLYNWLCDCLSLLTNGLKGTRIIQIWLWKMFIYHLRFSLHYKTCDDLYIVDATWSKKESFRQFLTLIYNYEEEFKKIISCVFRTQDIPLFHLDSILLWYSYDLLSIMVLMVNTFLMWILH